jgi:uncharacterized protein
MADGDVTVRDDGHRFFVREGDDDAELVYRAHADRLILVHTEVPPAFRGHGVGAHLVEAALARARRTGEAIVAWCPYARRWLEEHPDRTAGVTIEWDPPPPPPS